MTTSRVLLEKKRGGVTNTVVNEGQEIHIPLWVVDLDSFRRWTDQDEFPEDGRIWWLRRGVWIDMSKEQLFTHIQVKDQFTRVLGGLVEREGLGWYFSDGLLLTNVEAKMSGRPDGTFISERSLDERKIRWVENHEGGYTEAEGTPDMVLEVVSRSSVRKDTVELFEAYWEAGIAEYWLVDARKEPVRFDLYRHGEKGYVASAKRAGWVRSRIFGKWFRLRRTKGPREYPNFALAIR
jgi:Uma2 family endonuclease